MDYEKKYKDALERAKEIIECSKSDTKEVRMVLSFFPELKESEDEKIKRVIMNAITKVNYSELDGLIPDTIRIWINKQGDQKPAEWDEEDEAIYYGVIETEQYMLDVVNGIKKFNVGNISIKEECTRELNWLKNRLKSLKPQKQDVMSEDEFRHIVGYLVQDIVANEHMAETEKQPTKFFAEKYYKKLSSQSTWKPSDEQMKVLNEVINFAADHGTMRWNDYIYNVLKGLREQLKKL